jgi:hypothetical protein
VKTVLLNAIAGITVSAAGRLASQAPADLKDRDFARRLPWTVRPAGWRRQIPRC